jgi:TctA family transporter
MTGPQAAGPLARLDALVVRPASDIALGGIALAAGAFAIWDARGATFGSWDQLGGAFFPTGVGFLLVAAALVLFARAAFFRPAQPARWRWRDLLVVIVAAAAVAVALTQSADLLLRLGPPEIANLVILSIAVALALARLSRVRAAAMALLGLMLSAVGMDAITGELRLTLGVRELVNGIAPVVSLGLVIVADAALCLASPSLFVASYGRIVAGWRDREIPRIAAIGMRVAAALALAWACDAAYDYSRYRLDAGPWEVVELIVLGALGVACKLLGWNRFALVLAFAYGTQLEESIRQSMLIAAGDPTIFLRGPIGATLAIVACGVLAAGALASLRRVRHRRPSVT